MDKDRFKDIEYVFFDVDGVLSAPLFKDEDGNIISGFYNIDDWYAHNIRCDAYATSVAPKLSKDFVKILDVLGKRLFCLTTETLSFVYYNKVKFIMENYPEFKDQQDIIYVSEDVKKIVVIKEIAKRDNIKLSECLLVEDTLNTILLAENEGIKTMHISYLLNQEGLG